MPGYVHPSFGVALVILPTLPRPSCLAVSALFVVRYTEDPLINLVLLFLGAMILVFFLQLVYRHVDSPVAITIAIDHFQILSVFSSLNLQWPDALITAFRAASASASNVDIFQPSCAFRITYTELWYMFQSLPLTMMTILLVVHAFLTLSKYLKRRSLMRHGDKGVTVQALFLPHGCLHYHHQFPLHCAHEQQHGGAGLRELRRLASLEGGHLH